MVHQQRQYRHGVWKGSGGGLRFAHKQQNRHDWSASRSGNGSLAVTFTHPLCVDKAGEIGEKILHDPNFKPEKTYTLHSAMVTPANAAEAYQKSTFAGMR